MIDESKRIHPNPTNGKGGMTLREHYAGLALQGLLANGDRGDIAADAVRLADALIEELSK